MAQKATCDRCNSQIAKGGGYSFFSSAGVAELGLKKVGHMLLCQPCTDSVINAENWKISGKDVYLAEMALYDALADLRESPSDGAKMTFHESLRRANDACIVDSCKAQDISPEEAKAKTQEFD